MAKIDLGQTIQVLANVGVIAGIIFLAVEIRQNNRLMMAQTRSDIAQEIAGSLRAMSMSEFAGDVAQPEVLQQVGSVEALRFQNYNLAVFRMWENIHYQWSLGLYEDSEFAGEKEIWAEAINRPSLCGLFCRSRNGFSAEFRSEIEAILERPC